jgi:SNF2 family DNA or RNA helicase
VICQKSKIDDWVDHFREHYADHYTVYDLTKPKELTLFLQHASVVDEELPRSLGVVNYELAFRRPSLLKVKDFTLMLDESSLIQNEQAKRSKFILKMKPENVILLSGTPTGGKYETLWSQLHLLGWEIKKDLYWKQYVDVEIKDMGGFPLKIVRGYKNVDRLKRKMSQYGCRFLKTEEVFDLPDQVDQKIRVPSSKEYQHFRKESIVTLTDPEITLVGDTTLTKMLYERQLCGAYSQDKLEAFRDLLESSTDRLIVFYNFDAELDRLTGVVKAAKRPISVVNGHKKDLTAYEQHENSVTLIQYQAGAMGLNLQKSCRICYFTPPLSSELFEQSKKRTHRIGQKSTCFYYYLTVRGSVEEKIYKTLAMRRDYTERLFEKGE